MSDLYGKDVAERFLARVVVTENGCSEWQGARNRKGYGHVWHNGKHWSAHRLAYEMFVGPIPDELTIDHLCRNTACVNPEHMEPVTRAENVRRGIAGEQHYLTRLTAEDVREIRARASDEWGSRRRLAEEYGISQQALCDLLKGRTWKSVA